MANKIKNTQKIYAIVLATLLISGISSIIADEATDDIQPMDNENYKIFAGGAISQSVFEFDYDDLTKTRQTVNHTGIVCEVLTDDEYLYVATDNPAKRVYKYDLATLTEQGNYSYGDYVYAMAQDAEYIYAGGSWAVGTVHQIWKSNMTLKGETPSYGGGGNIRAVRCNENYIYAGGAFVIEKYLKTDLSYVASTASFGSEIYDVVLDDTYVYACGGGSRIRQYWQSNMTEKASIIGFGGTSTFLRAIDEDDTYLYVGLEGIHRIWKSNMTEKDESSTYGGGIADMQIHEDYIYAAGFNTNRVYRYYLSNMTKKDESDSYGGTIYGISVADVPLLIENKFIMKPEEAYVLEFREFNISIEVEPMELIDAVATDLITFDPSIVECKSIEWGDLFEDTTVQIKGTIDNTNGTIKLMAWGSTIRTDQPGIFVNITFKAISVGETNIVIDETKAGISRGGYGVTHKVLNNILVNVTSYVPEAPQDFTANPHNRTQINLTWLKPEKSDYTWIEWNTTASWDRGEGNFLANTTGLLYNHDNLLPDETRHYRAWSWNATKNEWSITSSYDLATTISNIPPSISSPIPANESTIDVRYVDWSVEITDGDDATFDWTIECSDGNSSGDIGDTEGRKYLNLTNLEFGETYTVWVNATDPYITTERIYYFTIRDEYIPAAPTEFEGDRINMTALNLTWIKDSIADTTYIEVAMSETWNRGEEIEIYNGTGEEFLYDNLIPNRYYFQAWSYNATDNVYSATYAETSVLTGHNTPVEQDSENPANETLNVDITQSSVSIYLSDNESDMIHFTIESIYFITNVSSSGYNDTYTATLSTPLPYDTVVEWYVNATDGYEWTNRSYWFRTRDQYFPDAPTSFEANAYNTTQMNLTWVKGAEHVDNTIIYVEENGNWTEIYNGTAVKFNHTGLDPHTTYNYRAYSYNITDNLLNISFASVSNMTKNTPPNMPTNELPVNNAPYESVYNTYLSLQVSDDDGDELTVYFYWGNGTAIAHTVVESGEEASIFLPDVWSRKENDFWGEWHDVSWLQHKNEKPEGYSWYVIIDDGFDQVQSETFYFNTSYAWDITENKNVGPADVTLLVAYYGAQYEIPGMLRADITSDGRIGAGDVSVLIAYYGATY
jgi:hypothetical protein